MDQPRPWQTDEEIESESRRARYRAALGAERPPSPQATYGLLLSFLAVFVLEYVVLFARGEETFKEIFTIYAIESRFDWIERPWSPFVATLSHSPSSLGHIFFNGIALYFFGPMLESVLGRKRFVAFFILTGAVSSIAQAMLDPGYALGASGAIMALIGVAIVINPRSRLIIFPLPIPVPLWVAGLAFAAIDLLGAASGTSGVGNFAHLSGLAIGLAYGFPVRQEMRRRGLRFVS